MKPGRIVGYALVIDNFEGQTNGEQCDKSVGSMGGIESGDNGRWKSWLEVAAEGLSWRKVCLGGAEQKAGLNRATLEDYQPSFSSSNLISLPIATPLFSNFHRIRIKAKHCQPLPSWRWRFSISVHYGHSINFSS